MTLHEFRSMEPSNDPKAATNRRTRIFRSRRFWTIALFCLAVPLGLVLVDQFFWYPNSPRGKLDRIHLGMSRAEAEAILATMEEIDQTNSSTIEVRLIETWTLYDGYVNQPANVQLSVPTPMLIGDGELRAVPEMKWTPSGLIVITFDAADRVDAKQFLGSAPSAILQRFRTWLEI